MVQDPVQSLLSRILIATPSRSDASPASLCFNIELERVGCLRSPRHWYGLEVASSKQVKVLNGVSMSKISDLCCHATLCLICGHNLTPLVVRPSAPLFCKNVIPQTCDFGQLLLLRRLDRYGLSELGESGYLRRVLRCGIIRGSKCLFVVAETLLVISNCYRRRSLLSVLVFDF